MNTDIAVSGPISYSKFVITYPDESGTSQQK